MAYISDNPDFYRTVQPHVPYVVYHEVGVSPKPWHISQDGDKVSYWDYELQAWVESPSGNAAYGRFTYEHGVE